MDFVDILYVLSYQEMGSCNTYIHTKHKFVIDSVCSARTCRNLLTIECSLVVQNSMPQSNSNMVLSEMGGRKPSGLCWCSFY